MASFKQDVSTLGGFFTAMLVAPFLLGNDYYVNILTISSLNALIAIGLNLLMGYAGQASIGHAAFYGIAAYTTAILTAKFNWPIPLGMLAGVGASTLTALLVGIPTLKLKGNYLAMATLGFGIIVNIFFNEAIELTGGPSGFTGIPRFGLFGYVFESDISYYYLTACLLTLGVFLSINIVHSDSGRALLAIHTSEKAAQSLGIDIAGHKLMIFILSAVYAGVAGVFYAHYLTFIAPSSFNFHFSVVLLTMVVLGGMARIFGALIGAFFLTILPEFLRAFENIDVLIYGAMLVVCVMYLPEGLAGGISRLIDHLLKKLKLFKSSNAA